MAVGNHSRPPSRRKETGIGQKDSTASHKYSTISAIALNQLLQSPKKLMKNNDGFDQERPVLERTNIREPQHKIDHGLKNINDPKQKSDNGYPVKLPSIFGTNHSEANREVRSPKGRKLWSGDVLPEVPVKHSARLVTPTDEFLHNKMKSTRGCSAVTDDESQKRLRQKAVLKQQIEEKRRQQEREQQEIEQQNREDEERVNREIAILHERFEIEKELERKLQDKLPVTHGPHEHIPQQIMRPQTPISPPNKDSAKLIENESALSSTTTLKPFADGIFNATKAQRLSPLPVSSITEDNKLTVNLQNLTELCEKLMQEQQRIKAELEEQRRQTLLLFQDRKLSESLKEHLYTLQEQLTLLTPQERAMLRIREHRRKQDSTNAQKQEVKDTKQTSAIASIIEGKVNKPAARKRGSWATQSKAVAPAHRESICEMIIDGDLHHNDGVKDIGEELGCTSKLVYPEDSLWNFHLCESLVEGENSTRSSSRRSHREENRDPADPGRISSKPGIIQRKRPTIRPVGVVPKRHNG